MDPKSDVGFAQFYPKRCLFGASTFVFFCYQNLGFSMPKKRHLTWSNATCCNRDDVILLVKKQTDSVRFFVIVDSINPFQRKHLTM